MRRLHSIAYAGAGAIVLAMVGISGSGTACSGTGGTTTSSNASTGSGPACKLADLGDPTKPIDLELTVLQLDTTSVPLIDGADVPLTTPPQGGRVLFIGVRATNLSPCSVTIQGSLKDTMSGHVTFEKRSINLKPQPDGYGTSSDTNPSSFSNIPVCPNQWSSRDAYDQPYELTEELTDHEGRTVSKTITITPRCSEPGQLMTSCLCQCKTGYTLGSMCP